MLEQFVEGFSVVHEQTAFDHALIVIGQRGSGVAVGDQGEGAADGGQVVDGSAIGGRFGEKRLLCSVTARARS